LQSSAERIDPIPHELADNCVAFIEVVARPAYHAPASADDLSGRADRYIDDHCKVGVQPAFVTTVVILRLEKF